MIDLYKDVTCMYPKYIKIEPNGLLYYTKIVTGVLIGGALVTPIYPKITKPPTPTPHTHPPTQPQLKILF